MRDRKEYFLTLAGHFDNRPISRRYFEVYYRAKYVEWLQIFMTNSEWDEYEYGDLVAECAKFSLV